MKEELKSFFEKKQDVKFAFLYGSMRDDSDVDIAIFLNEEPKEKLMAAISFQKEIEDLIEKEVDVLILNGAPLEMSYSAQKGMLLYERDPEERKWFEVNIRKQYWDFTYRNRIYLKKDFEKIEEMRKWHLG